jgi:glycosyltransferase involved in cell wall biosynthesis
MKILQLTSHLDVGGISRYTLSLSQRLAARGHQVCVASGGGTMEKTEGNEKLAFYRVPLKTSQEFGPKVFKAVRELTAYLEKEPVDIIHAHTRVAQVVADRLSRRLKIPYVTTWHGIYKMRLGRRLYPCTGAVAIAISGIVERHLRDDFHLSADRVCLVYNGIRTARYVTLPVDETVVQEYRSRWNIPQGCPVIGSMGRLAAGEVKGFDLLLAAACLAKKTIPNIHVLIVGDGPRRPFLEDVAERLGILSQVHFVGGVEDVRIPLSLMDVFVFPSRWPEAFGLTLIEAMAAGKPVIATHMGAVSEILRDGQDGILVPAEDIRSLAENVIKLLKDTPLAHAMGQQARLSAQNRFDVERTVAGVEAVYRRVLSRSKDAGRVVL